MTAQCPGLVFADAQGQIYDHPHLKMLCLRGQEFALPRPDDLIPLPQGSDLFLLPHRHAVGLDPQTGQAEVLEEQAVAAFVCPGYTVTGISAYFTKNTTRPPLPLLSYGAVGYAKGTFWVCAKQVDTDKRQVFSDIPEERIRKGAHAWLKAFPNNRLVSHLARCALTSCCPAAKNLALGRFEAPLPTARHCNANCLGCISHQAPDSGITPPQQRISFRPSPKEIQEIMTRHASKAKNPILSFGQGCEGEPLLEAPGIAKATALFRQKNTSATVNINTNASLPESIPLLAEAGTDSIRISLNSANPALYNAYYRPTGYKGLEDVKQTIHQAKTAGLYISLNYLFFPGISDTETELEALVALVSTYKIDCIQLRNLNIDPQQYIALAGPCGPGMGFTHFSKRLKKNCPWLRLGYFNPFVRGN